MVTTEDELLATCASMQKQIDDLRRQCEKLFSFHGQNWKNIERQGIDNAQSAGTRAPFARTAAFGETGNQKPLAN
jgi:hypothetical protein